jgi:phosphoglycerate dehydrogenase-like enzyme
MEHEGMGTDLPVTVALSPAFPRRYEPLLTAVSQRVRLAHVGETSGDEDAVSQAEVLGCWDLSRERLAVLAPRMPRLRWIQSPVAGVGDQRLHEVLTPSVVITGAAGVYADMVAEHALLLMLALYRRLPELLEFQHREHWDSLETRTLSGQTLGVVGAGGIGQSLARMARPLGMQIWGIHRGDDPLPDFDRTVPHGDLAILLAGSDVVVLAVPLTEQTRGLVNRSFLQAMRPEAILINVARGKVVVTDDLLEALREGTIAGAGLDVTDPEPLPRGHALWHEPRVIITPHHANPHRLSQEHAVRRFAENLHRYLAGEPLVAVIEAQRGY